MFGIDHQRKLLLKTGVLVTVIVVAVAFSLSVLLF